MITRRIAFVGLALTAILGPTAASAADQSAREFLAAIYNAYKGKSDDAKGIPLDAKTIPRYFEPTLAQLMIKDMQQAAKRQEVGKLGGDPFIDAQDWEIDDINIAVRATGADKANGTVSFKNFNKSQAIVLSLVKLKEGWRIQDIRWTTKRTLRALFAAK